MKRSIEELEKHLKQLQENITEGHYGGSLLILKDSIDELNNIKRLANNLDTSHKNNALLADVEGSLLDKNEAQYKGKCKSCGSHRTIARRHTQSVYCTDCRADNRIIVYY